MKIGYTSFRLLSLHWAHLRTLVFSLAVAANEAVAIIKTTIATPLVIGCGFGLKQGVLKLGLLNT